MPPLPNCTGLQNLPAPLAWLIVEQARRDADVPHGAGPALPCWSLAWSSWSWLYAIAGCVPLGQTIVCSKAHRSWDKPWDKPNGANPALAPDVHGRRTIR